MSKSWKVSISIFLLLQGALASRKGGPRADADAARLQVQEDDDTMEEEEGPKRCDDFCIKCPGPRRKSLFVRRTPYTLYGDPCAIEFVLSSDGIRQEEQQFLVTNTMGGMHISSGTAKLRRASASLSDIGASAVCDTLKQLDATAEQLEACAAHSMLCDGSSPEDVVGVFGHLMPSGEEQCAQLSALDRMPLDLQPFIVYDQDEDEGEEEKKEEEEEEEQEPVEPIDKPLDDCKSKTQSSPWNSCHHSSRCTWDKGESEQCVALCDHPRMRDSEVPCASQTHCRWNAERHNSFTDKAGLCEYLCPGSDATQDWQPCGTEEATRASRLHLMVREQADGSWHAMLEGLQEQRCYDAELMEEQLRFDRQRATAPAARVCDYEHDHSFVHQYLKHDGSVNCHELPHADPANASTDIKQMYLEAGCWPFVRTATIIRGIVGRVAESQEAAKNEEQKKLLRSVLTLEDVLQRLAKYSFNAADKSKDGLSSVAASAANAELVGKLMAYLQRQVEETQSKENVSAMSLATVPRVQQRRDRFLSSVQEYTVSSVSKNEPIDALQLKWRFLQEMSRNAVPGQKARALYELVFDIASTILQDVMDDWLMTDDVRFRHAMQCIPALWGRIGFAIGGMRNDGNYLDLRGALRSNRFWCSVGSRDESDAVPWYGHKRKVCAEVCVEEAPLSSACSRAAMTQMNFWMGKMYGQTQGFLNMARTSPSMCLRQEGVSQQYSNCWLFQACAKEVASEVICRLHPDCCSGDLVTWKKLKRSVDRFEFTNRDQDMPDTPTTRLVNYCNKHPNSVKC